MGGKYVETCGNMWAIIPPPSKTRYVRIRVYTRIRIHFAYTSYTRILSACCRREEYTLTAFTRAHGHVYAYTRTVRIRVYTYTLRIHFVYTCTYTRVRIHVYACTYSPVLAGYLTLKSCKCSAGATGMGSPAAGLAATSLLCLFWFCASESRPYPSESSRSADSSQYSWNSQNDYIMQSITSVYNTTALKLQ